MAESDRFGLAGWFGGMIPLILLGVALSVAVDRRFAISKNNCDTEEEIPILARDIVSLSAIRERLQDEVTEGTRAKTARDELRELRIRREENHTRLAHLQPTAMALESECQNLTKTFDRYRSFYRSQTWRNAAGERLGALNLNDGRQFTGVSIVRVTPEGLEIAHDKGRARIARADLGPAWQERLQWDDR